MEKKEYLQENLKRVSKLDYEYLHKQPQKTLERQIIYSDPLSKYLYKNPAMFVLFCIILFVVSNKVFNYLITKLIIWHQKK